MLFAAAMFTVHVKGVRRVALQNVKFPEKWLQVKDDELSGNVSMYITAYHIVLHDSIYVGS